MEIRGRTAFVTGAASGIGLGIARGLARAGAKVALADIRQDGLDEAAARVAEFGGAVETVVVDVSDRAAFEAGVAAAEAALGPIGIAVNSAGVAMHGIAVDQVSPRDWDWVLGVNLYGTIHGSQIFAARMRAHGKGGHIVNTASIGGLQVRKGMQGGAYSVSKFGVVALTEALEIDLADAGIGVSLLCPGAVRTAIALSGRSRPGRLGGPAKRPEFAPMGELVEFGMDPDAVGTRVVQAIGTGEFYVFTHTTPQAWLEERHARMMKAFDAAGAFEKGLAPEVAGRMVNIGEVPGKA